MDIHVDKVELENSEGVYMIFGILPLQGVAFIDGGT